MSKIKDAQIINEIIDKYPNSQWHDRILKAIPGIDKGYLISVVEIANGGDVIGIDDGIITDAFCADEEAQREFDKNQKGKAPIYFE